MPDKRIIILGRSEEGDPRGGQQAAWAAPSFSYLLRADVPMAHQKHHVDPEAASAYVDITPQELAEIRAGKVVERVGDTSISPGYTMAEMQSDLEEIWQRFQDEVTRGDDWKHYGTSWDGSSWLLG